MRTPLTVGSWYKTLVGIVVTQISPQIPTPGAYLVARSSSWLEKVVRTIYLQLSHLRKILIGAEMTRLHSFHSW